MSQTSCNWSSFASFSKPLVLDATPLGDQQVLTAAPARTGELSQVASLAKKVLEENHPIKEIPSEAFLQRSCLCLYASELQGEIGKYNNQIDGATWITVVHILLCILTIGIFSFRDTMKIESLKWLLDREGSDLRVAYLSKGTTIYAHLAQLPIENRVEYLTRISEAENYEKVREALDPVLDDPRFAHLLKCRNCFSDQMPPELAAASLFLSDKPALLEQVTREWRFDQIRTFFGGEGGAKLWNELFALPGARAAFAQFSDSIFLEFIENSAGDPPLLFTGEQLFNTLFSEVQIAALKGKEATRLYLEFSALVEKSPDEIKTYFTGAKGADRLEKICGMKHPLFSKLDPPRLAAIISCAEGEESNSFITKIEEGTGKSSFFTMLRMNQWDNLEPEAVMVFAKIAEKVSFVGLSITWNSFKGMPEIAERKLLCRRLAASSVEAAVALFSGEGGERCFTLLISGADEESFGSIPVKTIIGILRGVETQERGVVSGLLRRFSGQQRNALEPEDVLFIANGLRLEGADYAPLSLVDLLGFQKLLKEAPMEQIDQLFDRPESEKTRHAIFGFLDGQPRVWGRALFQMTREEFAALPNERVQAFISRTYNSQDYYGLEFVRDVVDGKPPFFALLSKEHWAALTFGNIRTFVSIFDKVDFRELTISKEEFVQLPGFLQAVEKIRLEDKFIADTAEIGRLFEKAESDLEGARTELFAWDKLNMERRFRRKEGAALFEKLFFVPDGREAFARFPRGEHGFSPFAYFLNVLVNDDKVDGRIIALADNHNAGSFCLKRSPNTGEPLFFSLFSKKDWEELEPSYLRAFATKLQGVVDFGSLTITKEEFLRLPRVVSLHSDRSSAFIPLRSDRLPLAEALLYLKGAVPEILTESLQPLEAKALLTRFREAGNPADTALFISKVSASSKHAKAFLVEVTPDEWSQVLALSLEDLLALFGNRNAFSEERKESYWNLLQKVLKVAFPGKECEILDDAEGDVKELQRGLTSKIATLQILTLRAIYPSLVTSK